ncbi:MAG: hypothetical protein Q7I99_05940 [Acholeplasmataceae bacterium]|nr:hypothetical protein [Acholeplasmataceae bacterium]
MNFIKNFKNVLSQSVTTLILVLIAVYILFTSLGNTSNIWLFLAGLVPLLLVLFAVLGLQLGKKSMAAHLILLITLFLGAGRAFLLVLTSFDFSSFSFNETFSLELIINVIIFVYLVLIVLSGLLTNEFKGGLGSSPVVMAAIIAFIFFFFRDGFSEAVLKIFPPVVALMFGSPFFAIVLLLAGVADVPFRFLNVLFNGDLFASPISYFLFTAFAFYLIFGAVTSLLKYKK